MGRYGTREIAKYPFTVGDKVIVASGMKPWRYGIIDKETATEFQVDGVRYKKQAWEWSFPKMVRQGYTSESGYLYPVDAKHEKLLAENLANHEARRIAQLKADAIKAEEKAKRDAFLATPEGKAYTAMQERWEGTEVIEVYREVDNHRKRAKLAIVNPADNYEFSHVNISQSTDWDTKQWGKADISGYGSFSSASKAAKYLEMFAMAVFIAKQWEGEVDKLPQSDNI